MVCVCGLVCCAPSLIFIDWSLIDALYFAMVTLLTVGYGDLIPSSTKSKWFTMLFAFCGIAIIGFALGKLANWLIDIEEKALKLASKNTQNALKQTLNTWMNNTESLEGKTISCLCGLFFWRMKVVC